jgi:hypothetical protein
MGLIHIYATLSAVEHMTAQFMLSTGLRIAVLRVLPHQAGAARIRVSDARRGTIFFSRPRVLEVATLCVESLYVILGILPPLLRLLLHHRHKRLSAVQISPRQSAGWLARTACTCIV